LRANVHRSTSETLKNTVLNNIGLEGGEIKLSKSVKIYQNDS